jgi:acetolactate decarboxylase
MLERLTANTRAVPGQHEITQVSMLGALLNGMYDGSVTLQELLRHGDFGIGTFDHLDGEMVLLDGQLFQIRGDGAVVTPDLGGTTPFAVVTTFAPEERHDLASGLTLRRFQAEEDAALPNLNIFHALKVTGRFSSMTCRSIPRQLKPYRPLAVVAREESIFEFSGVEGTLVGFRCPEYVAGINLPGYHLHFISDDGTKGGHVLDFTVAKATAETDYLPNFAMMLPDSDTFSALKIATVDHASLEAIENEIPHEARIMAHH